MNEEKEMHVAREAVSSTKSCKKRTTRNTRKPHPKSHDRKLPNGKREPIAWDRPTATRPLALRGAGVLLLRFSGAAGGVLPRRTRRHRTPEEAAAMSVTAVRQTEMNRVLERRRVDWFMGLRTDEKNERKI